MTMTNFHDHVHVHVHVNDHRSVMMLILFNLPDAIIERGEKLDLLVDKTEDLSNNSVSFRNQGRSLQVPCP